ncbi:MAG TPA: DUF6265 family protein [Casimicrobiaceae bacterium]|nr:DUF6265 family protein [Casimicrobiaceae bacterium]
MTPFLDNDLRRHPATLALAIIAALLSVAAKAQQPPVVPTEPSPPAPAATSPASTTPSATTPAAAGAASTAPPADTGPLAALAWLEGCWLGNVNQREFREQWLPLRGGILIGAGQSVLRGKMQDYEFLRIEPRADGVFFSQFSGDLKETSFKLDSKVDDDKDTIFTFANTTDSFPSRLIYRRGTEGWLYETIEGKTNGSTRQVIYPLRRIDCETGELIGK